ncbi:lysine N(6)-hydroxylase/L-ornithine N(5)-oxygenase family protein [Paenibacillus qinlingensis]|uniref:lysine N(6)-hydroxylase/L-ornithine N(5)-oxygenase family protein n=1 Tax=Paenibacillus qinlingensis TaxID=1837343 RepID=UPI0015660778|nr:lysine N(6)-hydroxylase/L-ornithine N(5)-oxygenase family protein [Paenibacillus qinlingensis]NQX61428.1 lysine N(6)-hydroxylase/L-ornithine N(5)-oxygenase family protein [Paenibacillus qinlingensis]
MARQVVPNHSDEWDVLGVGVGPFNLGLAALLTRVPELKAQFLERKPQFDWHPGMLIEGTTLQVPFFADLVTMADPTHPLSFLNYLHEHGRLYHFYFLEKFQIPRKEYNHYCKWAAERLASCRFGYEVSGIHLEEGESSSHFVVEAKELQTEQTKTYVARNLVLGVGSRPHIPKRFQHVSGPNVFHSADYLTNRERCLKAQSITVVGSGQSAAEVVLDLLRAQSENGYRLDWFTRSSGFFPMEYSKLGLEHFSPEYTKYFYDLAPERKDSIRAGQGLLYKGISAYTIADIYDTLYEAGVGGQEGPGVRLLSLTEVEGLLPTSDRGNNGFQLHCRQLQQDAAFEHTSEIVILATGYEHAEPACLSPLEPFIYRDAKGRLDIAENYSLKLRAGGENQIFIQNGELHTHGVGAPDLGLGAHRNSVIIKQLTQREVYPIRSRNVFQQFGVNR